MIAGTPAASWRPVLAVFGAAVLAGCAASPVLAPAARRVVHRVTVAQARDLIALYGADLIIVDVRSPEEFVAGHLPGAINLDENRPDIEACLLELDWTETYLVYCRAGVRSARAALRMVHAGLARVHDMTEGITGWLAAGGEIR